jgi:hypothetical protein
MDGDLCQQNEESHMVLHFTVLLNMKIHVLGVVTHFYTVKYFHIFTLHVLEFRTGDVYINKYCIFVFKHEFTLLKMDQTGLIVQT